MHDKECKMELVNSNSEKKLQQVEVFKKFSSLLTPEQKKLGEPYASVVGGSDQDVVGVGCLLYTSRCV